MKVSVDILRKGQNQFSSDKRCKRSKRRAICAPGMSQTYRLIRRSSLN